jgi:2-furoyl-CoA dehydrogenase FAD binding subunit
MKPAAFDYLRPDSVDEIVATLGRHGEEARVLAGGQSLMPMLNMRLVQPAIVIDIANHSKLSFIKDGNGFLTIGAAVTQAALQERATLADEIPLLAEALPWVGHYQTRNRGTVCGSIAHADPSAELPLCLLALGGDVGLRSTKGKRRVPADAFFHGTLLTARAADEMIEYVRYPRRSPGAGYAFREVAARHGDFALVACASAVSAKTIRLAVGGVADRPVVREWSDLDAKTLPDALNDFAWELRGTDDAHASARYRRELVRRIGRDVIEKAHACRK